LHVTQFNLVEEVFNNIPAAAKSPEHAAETSPQVDTP